MSPRCSPLRNDQVTGSWCVHLADDGSSINDQVTVTSCINLNVATLAGVQSHGKRAALFHTEICFYETGGQMQTLKTYKNVI